MDNLTTTVSAVLRKTIRSYRTLKARLRSKAFYCKALDGDSNVNICINSDLTVSCNCHDVDGSGHIGDLRHQSLEECLSGPTAVAFRRRLAQGRLPIDLCARCCDLRMDDKDKASDHVENWHLPDFVMVENTSACNLRCMSCPRSTIRRLREKPSMSLSDVQKVADELAACGVGRIAYLNLGEPFLSKNILRELEIIRERIPNAVIGTSTNGMVIDCDKKREAALLMDTMQISLDGIDQKMANRYQRGCDFQKTFDNMKSLVEYRDSHGEKRPKIIWKYVLFWWNDRNEYLEKAIEMAKEAKVDEILFEKTLSPFYAVPIRSYLGFHDKLGEDVGNGDRVVRLRFPSPLENQPESTPSISETTTEEPEATHCNG